MLRRLFHDHPADLGESYGEHFRTALGFGAAMIAGGAACIVHALVPGWFPTTGSGTVKRLHALMVAKRDAKRAAKMISIEWVI